MAWVTPKTNWVDGDYFNINPDYNRIKGNIEYLLTLSNRGFQWNRWRFQFFRIRDCKA